MSALLLNDVRRVLTLLAGFTIGMHVANFLHELGHALGCWLSGGRVTAIVIQSPMPAGFVDGHAPNPFLTVWGGVAFGSLSTLAPLAMAHWLRNNTVALYLALMTAAFCLGHNALYLVVGGIVPYADAENMIKLGAPQWLLVVLGIPLLIGFVLVLATAIQPVGLRTGEPLWRWIIFVEAGLLTTPALMVAGLGFDPNARPMLPAMLVLVGSYAVCFGVAAHRARSAVASRGADFEKAHMPQSWSTTSALLVGACVLVAGEWLAFGPARPGAGPQEWEIIVANNSELPCSIFVTLGADANYNAKVENVAKEESIVLVSGISDTVVRTVKVVRGQDEQTLAPNMVLPVGKRYAIMVGTDGKLEASVLAK